MVALVGGGRQQQQVPGVALEGLGQLVVLGPAHPVALAVGGQVVGLVEDHQVPRRRLQDPAHPGGALQGVDAGDQAVVAGEGVRAPVGHVALGPEDLEVQVEDLVQLALPVVDQARGDHHQGPAHLAPAGQLAQDQGGLDGLAQAHLVGHQEAPGAGLGHVVGQHHLVGQQVHPGRGQGGGVLDQGQAPGLQGKPGPPGAPGFAPHPGQDPLVPGQGGLQGGGAHLALAGLEEDADQALGAGLHHDPGAEVGMPDPLARAELRGGQAQETLGWCRPIQAGPSQSWSGTAGSRMRRTSDSAPDHSRRPRGRVASPGWQRHR